MEEEEQQLLGCKVDATATQGFSQLQKNVIVVNCFADNFLTPAGSNCQFLCSRVYVLWSEPTKIGQ
jgi:hypothetical protein